MVALEQNFPEPISITRAVLGGPSGSNDVLVLFLSIPTGSLEPDDSSTGLKDKIVGYLQKEGYRLFPEIPFANGLGVRYLEGSHQCMLSLKITATDGTRDDRLLSIAQRLDKEGKLSDPGEALNGLWARSGLSQQDCNAHYGNFMKGLRQAVGSPSAEKKAPSPVRR